MPKRELMGQAKCRPGRTEMFPPSVKQHQNFKSNQAVMVADQKYGIGWQVLKAAHITAKVVLIKAFQERKKNASELRITLVRSSDEFKIKSGGTHSKG